MGDGIQVCWGGGGGGQVCGGEVYVKVGVRFVGGQVCVCGFTMNNCCQ